ncbi:hypothetical protein HTZ84_21030 [Haloterrigena sp. SYSU A558-1]|uniref:Uncharacterized protein n=1 Tax=Haloterrigena gelatinilytica TaxID=2741724 RepID=A0ABX2LHX8_9EURY|nr:hypothetical protein [Haloterrigena gelatinilytica]NUC74749.1 hypothetical protein [Haloterrigena gelatinilytica]
MSNVRKIPVADPEQVELEVEVCGKGRGYYLKIPKKHLPGSQVSAAVVEIEDVPMTLHRAVSTQFTFPKFLVDLLSLSEDDTVTVRVLGVLKKQRLEKKIGQNTGEGEADGN